jgi:hypothetical protein
MNSEYIATLIKGLPKNETLFNELEEKLRSISWIEKVDLIKFALVNNIKISNEVIAFECIDVICHEILIQQFGSFSLN